MERLTRPHRILCCVTNDLCYDQRMRRICGSLSTAGYRVTLIGRKRRQSMPIEAMSFGQERINCPFEKGFLFYAFFNLQLFVKLIFKPCEAICAVDLDTLLPALLAAKLKRVKLIYDAHEYFTEVPELVGRPFVKKIWSMLASFAIPKTDLAYTVGPALAKIFKERYHKAFGVIRNLPLPQETRETIPHDSPILLYQGMLNEGRGLEYLIEAMHFLPGQVRLLIAGEGDLSLQLRAQVNSAGLESRIQFLGMLKPEVLSALTGKATIGLNLLENKGLSYYYSLANKAFDYIQAGLPSIQMAFPEYQNLQQEWEVFALLHGLEPQNIASTILGLLNNPEKMQELRDNCHRAAKALHWKAEEKVLLQYYREILP